MGQQRKMDRPGEPIKNGTGGSFATGSKDADQGIDLGAQDQKGIAAQFLREQWLAEDDSEEGQAIAHAAALVGKRPNEIANVEVTDLGWVHLDLFEADPDGGYTAIGVRREADGDVIIYRRELHDLDGTITRDIHREDGPAEIRHGRERAFLDGVEQHCPNTLLGYRIRDEQFHFTKATRGQDGWDARWETTDGRSVTCFADGDAVFRNPAGDIERMGAPAIVDPYGTERWFHAGQEVPDPRPIPSMTERPDGPESSRTTGGRFNPDAKPSQIAEQVAADIARAQLVGLIPATAEISVTGSDKKGSLLLTGVPSDGRDAWGLVSGIVGQYNRHDMPPRGPATFHFDVTTVPA